MATLRGAAAGIFPPPPKYKRPIDKAYATNERKKTIARTRAATLVALRGRRSPAWEHEVAFALWNAFAAIESELNYTPPKRLAYFCTPQQAFRRHQQRARSGWEL